MNPSIDLEPELKYYTEEQLNSLTPQNIPKHIAMILDGNRRWAKQKKAPKVTEGHRVGADILLDVLKAAKEIGIKVMTLFVFSTENWMREPIEVMGLMWLFETYIRKQIPEMLENQIRFKTIGDVSRFPEAVQEAIADAKHATCDCKGMEVVFAMNYGARDEIKRAVQKIVASKVEPEEITETLIAAHLDTAEYPDPDLLIRTGGEDRVSNFLLWQLSYTELYTSPTLWPDFTPQDLLDAVYEYQQRERRTGL
jgi:undecaprenyl diphosphate synthase